MPKKNITIDDLAAMTQRGFTEINKTVKEGFEKVNKDTKSLQDGQEQIRLRLDNVPYRFEFIELQKRVQFIEKKMGIRP